MKVSKIVKSRVEEELQIIGATLLSIEETKEYLTEEERRYNNWWWLRSPGLASNCATYVIYHGRILTYGSYVNDIDVSVRPALQISNLKSSNLEIGDTFELGDYEFKIISDNLAWMYRQDIGQYAFNNAFKGNDYETSDVKKIVDEWFEECMRGETE